MVGMTSEFAIAVHAIVFLNHKKENQSSDQIAENVCTHPVRVRKILAKLHRAGLIETKEGLKGGYQFSLRASRVNLQMVCEALGMEPIEVKWKTGDVDMECEIASGMAGIMDVVYGDMNKACYKALSEISILDIDKKLFT